MIAALIFVISVAALGQFALFSWRAAFLMVASREVSLETRAAMGAAAASVEDGDFAGASKWLELSPNLAGEDRRLWTVKLYFVALRAIGGLSRMMFEPKLGKSFGLGGSSCPDGLTLSVV